MNNERNKILACAFIGVIVGLAIMYAYDLGRQQEQESQFDSAPLCREISQIKFTE